MAALREINPSSGKSPPKPGISPASSTSAMGSSSELEESEPSRMRESSSPPESGKVKVVVPVKVVVDGPPPHPIEVSPVEMKRRQSPSTSADMTPFQRRVANATCCCSFTVMLVIVLVVLALAIAHRGRHHQKVEALAECESPDCAPELRYLDVVVQANVNPCADFYGHVCYRWTEQHAGEGFLKDAYDRFFRILAGRVLQAPASGFGDKAQGFQVGKSLLEECVAYMNSFDLDLQRDVTTMLDVLDIKTLLLSETSRASMVHALNISFATGFHSLVGITRRKISPEERIYLHLYRVPSVRQQLQADYMDDNLEHYLKSVLLLISATHEARAIARDVIDMDSMVESFDTGETGDVWLDAAVLKQDLGFPAGLWSDAFRLFQAGGLSEADVGDVFFTGFNQTRGVSQYLDGSPTRRTVWYLTVVFLAQVLRFDYARRYLPLGTRNDDYLCLDAVNQALELHWHVFVRNLSFSENSDEPQPDASIFELIRERIVPDWLGNATVSLAKEKLRLTSFKGFFPAGDGYNQLPGADNLTYLVERTTSVLDRAFPASYVALRLATHRETVLVAPPEAAEADTARLWAHQWPVYREPHGNVILPVPYLERPLMYAVSSNAEVNYATVGVAVAKALSEAVGPYSSWNVSSSETLWESDASFSYSILAGCLRSHADPYIISHPDEPPPTRSSVYKASVFAWMRSARAALDALRDHIWSEKMTDDRWIRAQRVFFKRFCLLSCGSERTDPMSPLERCTWPLLSMPEFRNVFHCSNSTFERYDSSCVAF
ncbi:uncharacterized protein LOC144103619 [Amblyomma americanum]